MEVSTFASDVDSSGISNEDPANWPVDDEPGTSHNGNTVMVSDAESDYSGVTNEDLEGDEEMAWSPKKEAEEEDTRFSPKEEAFSDEASPVAEEIPAHQLLPVKEEMFSDASDADFAGFDETITSSWPAKRKRGLSRNDNSNVEEEDEDDGYQETSAKRKPHDPESAILGTRLPRPSNAVSLLRCVLIKPHVHVPKGTKRVMTKLFNCYYCPASFKMKAYLPRHVLEHLKNGDPKYEVFDLTGKKVHPAYVRGTVWPRPQSKWKQRWKSKPWRGKRSNVYHCYYCPASFRMKAYLPGHLLDHLEKGSPKFEVTDSTGRKVHPAYLLENGSRGLWPSSHKNQPPSDDRPFKCHLCSFAAKHQSVLRKHLKLKAKQALEPTVFSCYHCDWTTSKKQYLQKHVRRHIPGTHKCDFCMYRAHQRSELEIHRNNHTGEKPYACDMCDERFAGKCNLQRHMNNHKTRTHRCPHCAFSVAIGTVLSEHILDVHLGSRNYGCPLCDFEAGDIVALRTHARSFHRMKLEKVKCRYCDFETAKSATLNIHERTHVFPGGGYPCDQCAFVGGTNYNLKIHTWSHTGEKPFACDLCDYRTTSRKGLRQHVITHSDLKPVKCSHCDSTFKTKKSATEHERYVHNLVEKNFRCRLCSYKSYTKKGLRSHGLVHTGERNSPCPECKYISKSRSALKIHMRRSHSRVATNNPDDRPHKCELCNLRAANSGALGAHMKHVHPTASPYACDYCSATFKVKAELIDHERTHTGEKKRNRPKGVVYKKWKCRFCSFETIPFNIIKSHYEEIHPDEIKEEIIPELTEPQNAGGKKNKPKTRRKCRFCSFESTLRRTVRIHEQKHTYEMMGKIDDKVMRM